jgi:hypothetical protein
MMVGKIFSLTTPLLRWKDIVHSKLARKSHMKFSKAQKAYMLKKSAYLTNLKDKLLLARN